MPDPVADGRRRKMTTADRFWSKVRPASGDGCWLWVAATDVCGYGLFGIVGSGMVKAHRWAYEAEYGPIPGALFCCHRCDNPACVRPDHMFLGTQADNMRDCVAKGRQQRAEGHCCAKLSWAQVREIRARFAAGESAAAIAPSYGVLRPAIVKIVYNQRWRE